MIDAVLLASERGPLSQLSKSGMKTKLRLLGKPVLRWVMDAIREAGIKSVYVVTEKPDAIEPLVHPYKRVMSVRIAQSKPSDISEALLAVREDVSPPFMVITTDHLFPRDAISELLRAFSSGRTAVLTVPEEEGEMLLSVTSEGKVEGPAANGNYVYGGAFIADEEFAHLLWSGLSIGDAIATMSRKPVAAFWIGWWTPFVNPWDIISANYYLLSELVGSRIARGAVIRSTAIIDGPVIIEAGAEIEHYSVIRGPAYIGRDAFIGCHTFIRSYTSVERDAKIHSYSEVVWSSIQRGAVIGRASFIGFSAIGERAVVEPNVVSKLLLKKQVEGIRPIEVVRGKRKYLKLGTFVKARSRVVAGTVLPPGAVV